MSLDLLIQSHMKKIRFFTSVVYVAVCAACTSASSEPLEEVVLHEMILLQPTSTTYVIPTTGVLTEIRVTISTDDTHEKLTNVNIDFGNSGMINLPQQIIHCLPGPYLEAPHILISSKPFENNFRKKRNITLVLPFASNLKDSEQHDFSTPEAYILINGNKANITTVFRGGAILWRSMAQPTRALRQKLSGPWKVRDERNSILRSFKPSHQYWQPVQSGTPLYLLNLKRQVFVLEHKLTTGYTPRFVDDAPYEGK